MNRIILSGRLTRDPEHRYTSNGTPVCNFSLAVERPYKVDGEAPVDFINCVAWRERADFVNEYLSKGRKIVLEGTLIQERWKDKETEKNMSTYRVQMDRIDFFDQKRKAGEETPSPADDDLDGMPF